MLCSWLLKNNGIPYLIHYLDDVLYLGFPRSYEYNQWLSTTSVNMLGMPLTEEKNGGPIYNSGWDWKLHHLHAGSNANWSINLVEWNQMCVYGIKNACKKWEMHLACLLQYACKVFRPDHSFLWQIFEKMEIVKQCDEWARLNTSFRADLVCSIHF